MGMSTSDFGIELSVCSPRAVCLWTQGVYRETRTLHVFVAGPDKYNVLPTRCENSTHMHDA